MLVQATVIATFISAATAIVTGKPDWARNTFVIELEKDNTAAQTIQTFKANRKAHEDLYAKLSKRGTEFKVEQEFVNADVFKGASITFDDSVTVPQIEALGGVKKAWPVRYYTPGDYNVRRHHYDNLPRAVHHPHPQAAEQSRLLKKRAYTPPPASVYKNDKFAPHVQISADKLHEAGILGQGVKVAVIDTGVDYNHPALGGGFGPGFKITFGEDLVGDDYGDGSPAVPDKDPYDSCNIHGTHVSGIVGADYNVNNPLNFTGIAPYAELGLFRIFGCKGGYTTTDLIIKAFTLAYEAGADVITMSVGGASGWTTDPGSVVVDRINKFGVITTISAGNDGVEGSFYTSGPANGINDWSIASINSLEIFSRSFNTNTGKTGTYLAINSFNVSNLAVYATSTEVTPVDDGCANVTLPANFKKEKTAVVIRRGTCTFVQKIQNAVTAGAKYILIANNGGVNVYLGADYGAEFSALIDTDTGDYLRRRFREGKKTILDLSSNVATPIPNVNGGYNSDFTTYGPTNDMYQQPSFGGVGGNILSTYPLWSGSYNIISGTSMACPQIGASAALWLSARKSEHLSALQIKSLFSSTASFQYYSAATNQSLSPVIRTGSGLINVSAAISTKTLVEPYALYLNDTKFFKGTQTIKLSNLESKSKTYKVSHVSALTAYLYDEGETLYPSYTPEHTSSVAATVTFSSSSVTIGSLGEATLQVKVKAPTVNTRYPIYSGFVILTSGSEVLKVPYFGVANSLYNAQVIDSGSAAEGVPMPFIWTASSSTTPVSGGTVQTGNRTYTLSGNDYPTLFYRFAMGTAKFSVDLIDASQNITTTISNRDSSSTTASLDVTSITSLTPLEESTNKLSKRSAYGGVKTEGLVYDGEYWGRNSLTDPTDGNYENYFTWDGTIYTNGTVPTAVANGSYRFYFRALKITGNPSVNEDYESWLSPPITIKRS